LQAGIGQLVCSLQRIRKDSFYWYQRVIASHGRHLEDAGSGSASSPAGERG